MRRALAALAVIGLAATGACAPTARQAQTAGSARDDGFVSFTDAFVRFHDRTQGMPQAERVAAFRAEMNALLPGFYQPRNGATEAQYDARVARALEKFPAIRAQYERAAAEFAPAYARAIAHFRATFPDFRSRMPVYLVHSLGEMDGGTRTIEGREMLVFGADVIAQVHAPATIGPFLDHELFHVQHGAAFGECEQIWCNLWTEGLATYAAGALNPGADDDALMLTTPEPIRGPVEAKWREALCSVASRLDSTSPDDYAPMFFGRKTEGAPFPPRYGYYVGYRVAQEAAKKHDLAALSRMNNAEVRPMLTAIVDRMSREAGGCPTA